ncbi:MAG: hypothetical protein Q7T33_09380 [Dehalococcoidia bacterium]|nr:hypothetical protein [Dehalococcoidia bacterium]
MSPIVSKLYANGVALGMFGTLLTLIGWAVGAAADFWWLLWVGLAIFGVGAFLWIVASTAIHRAWGGVPFWTGLILALIGLIRGLSVHGLPLLWTGLGVMIAGFVASFIGNSLTDRRY